VDTSEAYIKMCERAVEIQRKARRSQRKEKWSGEWVYSGAVWLPRQDQLQEMVGNSPYNNIQNAMWSILDNLHKYAFTPNIFNEFIPTSMEQLWLAFVMKEKYGKVWNGEEWGGKGNQT